MLYACAAKSASEYYLSYIINSDGGNASISIITTDSQPVSYFIEAPGIGVYHNGTVTADNEATIYLPHTAEVVSHVEQNKGIYLKTSSDSVTIIGHNTRRIRGGSIDTFLVLPTAKLSIPMHVYFGISPPRSGHVIRYQNVVLIVGTEHNTIMKLTVMQSVDVSVGSTTTNLIPGREYSFVINRLQTVSVASREDMSGTKVVTNKPVSVYSGHQCANIPSDVTYCDHVIEQMPPTVLWGKVHYTAPLATRKSYTIKALAAHDSTNINIYCSNSLKLSYTANEGNYFDIKLQEYCALISNKEILVVQFGHGRKDDNAYGDPLMMLLPATTQYTYNFKFSTLHRPSYKHYVNIIVLAQYYQPDMMYLITGGVTRSLNTQQWVPVKVNNNIEAYAAQVSIPEGVAEVFHTNTAALFTTVVYGFDTVEGYGHPGGYYGYKTTSGTVVTQPFSY